MIDEASIVGIISDPRSKPSEDQYQDLVNAAEQHGLKVIIVGHDYDMGGDLMREIMEGERFEVIRQCVDKQQTFRTNLVGCGPRDKWGRLK